MSFSRLLIAASAVLILASCQGTGSVDASYPTVSELDRLDTQWGMTPRKSRGAPKRTFQYSAPSPTYNAPSASSAPAPVPTRETVNMPPPGVPAPQLDPAAINSLR